MPVAAQPGTPAYPSLRALQIEAGGGKKPKIVARMRDWQYLERFLHRLVTAWAWHFTDWEDKRAVCRHV